MLVGAQAGQPHPAGADHAVCANRQVTKRCAGIGGRGSDESSENSKYIYVIFRIRIRYISGGLYVSTTLVGQCDPNGCRYLPRHESPESSPRRTHTLRMDACISLHRSLRWRSVPNQKRRGQTRTDGRRFAIYRGRIIANANSARPIDHPSKLRPAWPIDFPGLRRRTRCGSTQIIQPRRRSDFRVFEASSRLQPFEFRGLKLLPLTQSTPHTCPPVCGFIQ